MNDRQRLEAIIAVVCKYLPPDGISIEKAMNEIIGLIDPLPPQLEQEPVAIRHSFDGYGYKYTDMGFGGNWIGWTKRQYKDSEPLYTHPQRKFVGLKDDEIDAIYTGVRAIHHEINSDLFARAIEAYLKDKNNA